MPSTRESILRPIASLVQDATKGGIEDEVLRVLHTQKVPSRVDHGSVLDALATLHETVSAQAATIEALTARIETLEAAQPKKRTTKRKPTTRRAPAKKTADAAE